MAIPKEARRFYRVAIQRLEDGQWLFRNERYSAAIYLAGYAVECILKALILAGTPESQHQEILRKEFRGSRAHDIAWLRERLRIARSAGFPGRISRDLAFVSTWSVDVRYNPGNGDEEESKDFLAAVERIVVFAKQRLI